MMQGAKMRAEGLTAGVWDVAVDIPVGRYHGLKIEFKKPDLKSDKNKLAGLSKEQIKYGKLYTKMGYAVGVAYSWREGVNLQLQYLHGWHQ